MHTAPVPLPFWQKLAYGSGELGPTVIVAFKTAFLFYFLTDAAQLSRAAAASIVVIATVWDAVSAPLVGWLSDRTPTRWGRRRPWLLLAALPCAALFFLLWWTPPLAAPGLYFFYLVIALLLGLAAAMIGVPYAALTPQLTEDYDERTSLTSFRASFAVAGLLLATLAHPLILDRFADPLTSYMVAGAAWAVVCIAPTLLVFFVIREPASPVTRPTSFTPMSFGQQLRAAFAVRPFRFVIALHLASWSALQVATAATGYRIASAADGNELGWIFFASIQASALVFLFVWSAVSRWLDKRLVYLLGASIWFIAQLAIYSVYSLYSIAPLELTWLLPLAVLLGAGVSIAYLIPWSMLPDVVEFDEWETGERREGVFYGILLFMQRIFGALALAVMSVMLMGAGFVAPAGDVAALPQPESAMFTIGLFIGPIPALLLACGLVIAFFYPISRTAHTQMRHALAQSSVGAPGGQSSTSTQRRTP